MSRLGKVVPLRGMGGLGACTPYGQPIPGSGPGVDGYYPNPWVEAPAERVPFDEIAAIGMPTVVAGETVVLQFQVPTGMDGVVFGIITRYVPGSLSPASGAIVWRMRHGQSGLLGTPVRNYARITVEWGDFNDYHTIWGGIPMTAEEFFVITATNVGGVASGAANLTVAGLNGYYWPRSSALR